MRLNDGDAVIFMNFRADRARELTAALTDARFAGFERAHRPKLGSYCTLTTYGEDFGQDPGRVPAARSGAQPASGNTLPASG